MSPALRSTCPTMPNYFHHGSNCHSRSRHRLVTHWFLESCVREKKNLFDLDIVELLLTKGGGMERNTAFVS